MLIRPAEPQDMGFVYSHFISSFREGSTHAEGLTGKQIASLLTGLITNGWTVTVAELSSALVGWIVTGPKPQQLAWVFSREFVRGQGLARLLIQHAQINPAKKVICPFWPNRYRKKPFDMELVLRPFEVIGREEKQ